jgi:class 3 adenylate cyclase/pimeloyl-ACP methyl ester carboxylesterase
LRTSAGTAEDAAVEPTFGYARASDGAYLAYSTTGEGPLDVLWQQDWFGNIDIVWEDLTSRRRFSGIAQMARLILHDRRGIGLSSRDVPVPNLETRVADLVTVLDTVGAERPVLGGEREGGSPNVLLAATQPERVRSLIWYAPSPRSVWTPDYPWGVRPEHVEHEIETLAAWGTTAYGERFIENEALADHDLHPSIAGLVARASRHTATPDVARRMSQIWFESDVRDVLPAVRVPTLILQFERPALGLEESTHVASLMAEAELVVLPGTEADGETGPFIDAIRSFLGQDRAPELDTILSTVLFTDIVDSTAQQASMGDRRWKDVVLAHHSVVRDALGRWRGIENDTAGDGFYATFDGPARAIRCAQEIVEQVRAIGIEIRAGVHTGECEVIDGKCGGLTVSIGARVAAQAGPSSVMVSQTVKDLVAGSGLHFTEAGEYELKGVPDRWRLYRVVAA